MQATNQQSGEQYLHQPERWHRYCENVFSHHLAGKTFGRNFKNTYKVGRPITRAWLSKMAELSHNYLVMGQSVGDIFSLGPKAKVGGVDGYESLCSAFNKELLRYQRKAVLRTLEAYEKGRHRLGYHGDIPDYIKAVEMRLILKYLRYALGFPEYFSDLETLSLIQHINEHYLGRTCREGESDRLVSSLYPQFVDLFCRPGKLPQWVLSFTDTQFTPCQTRIIPL